MAQSFIEVFNPANGALIGQVPEASVSDVATVVAQGLKGQAAMSATPAHRRQALLLKLADLI